jgi:hypothetical protein
MVMEVFTNVLAVVGQFVSSLFSLPFFGFSSFGVFFLVCFAGTGDAVETLSRD